MHLFCTGSSPLDETNTSAWNTNDTEALQIHQEFAHPSATNATLCNILMDMETSHEDFISKSGVSAPQSHLKFILFTGNGSMEHEI